MIKESVGEEYRPGFRKAVRGFGAIFMGTSGRNVFASRYLPGLGAVLLVFAAGSPPARAQQLAQYVYPPPVYVVPAPPPAPVYVYPAPVYAYRPPCVAVTPGPLGGAARGAGLGAIGGAIAGNAGKGAIIGAGVGVLGGIIRRNVARVSGGCY
jgi:Glycine-zipper domain